MIGAFSQSLCQESAVVEADIARRGADEFGDGVLLHEFAHVEPDHVFGRSEEEIGEYFSGLGFADARWP